MKTKTAKTSQRIGLYVTESRDTGYYHCRATIVVIGMTSYEMRRIDEGCPPREAIPYERIRNIDDTPHNGLYLNNLKITSQGCDDDQTRHLYGFECRYQDTFAIDERTAGQMHATLKTIRLRMEKTDQKYGHPATFGAYLARVAEAIGATSIVRPQGKNRGWSYSEMEHRVLSISDGIYHVDGLIRTWETERERKAEEQQREQRTEETA